MTEIDFITAFGRLLRDGKLRDRFAVDPRTVAEEIHLRQSDWTAWEQLVPADVEFQATVLLRKRLDLIKFFAPETCRRMGGKLWPVFYSYARSDWPSDGSAKISDAFLFCQHLKQQNPKAVAASERNRLEFALSKKPADLHWVEKSSRKRKTRRGLQLCLRGRGGRWWEFFFYFDF